MNLWFSWNWDATQLFIRMDPVLWEKCGQNPVLMLGMLSQEALDAAARDESFVSNLGRVFEQFSRYMSQPGWFAETYPAERRFLSAYFSTEYGLDEALPIYSGGLGVLSGDHLKSASDIGLPLVGVGLLYQKGYFRQVLNPDGWQHELYPDNDWYNMPVHPEVGADGKALTIDLDLAGEKVFARIWRVQVGRVPLILLDTNIESNAPRHREITSTLYGGDREMRIRQEMVLGVGGVRALKALGLEPTVFHMNEGHSAFLALERIRTLMNEFGVSYGAAREFVLATNVFTTHTPVPAGNETFARDLVMKYLQPIASAIGLSADDFLALGEDGPQSAGTFGMTVLALRSAGFANGVSRLHGEVARTMWKDLWNGLPEAEVPITSITNGIHTRSWISHDLGELFLRYLGPRFVDNPGDSSVWDRIDAIPSSELWRIHQIRKERLVFFVRKRLAAQLRRQGSGPSSMKGADDVLDPQALTLGFARRFATYKRAGLLFRQPDRLVRLLTDPQRPVQIIFAGKAHPQDTPAKEIIRSVLGFTRDPRLLQRLVFLEDYDINVARYLVQGVDVWMNTPRRPLEASGTSGMKAAANGALNCSVLDGWWDEGSDVDTGWAIGDGEVYSDPEEQDRNECESLYHLLENEMVPLFFDRDRSGMPREWLGMMKSSIRKLGSVFNTHRMVREYAERAYLPAHRLGRRWLDENLDGAKALDEWRQRVDGCWSQVSIHMDVDPASEMAVGTTLEVPVRVRLGVLTPDDVAVEVRFGPLGPAGDIRSASVVQAQLVRTEGDDHLFIAKRVCGTSGRCGFAARVLPQHPDLLAPFTPLRITWE